MTVAKRNKRVKPDPELVKLADSLLANYQKPEDLIGENGLLKQLTKMLVERALETEMSEHLGHGKSEAVTNATGNTRNGHSAKTLQGEFGELPLDIPRDRQGEFEPKLVARHQTRWSGFDDKIISLYARGLSVREIQGHLEEMYGTEVSPALISAVTDAVSEEVKIWQARPLDALYPIVYLDCIHVKVRDSGAVRTKAVYLGHRCEHEWSQGGPGAVDRPDRGREVLAAGGHRVKNARRAGHFYCLCRRAQRLPRSH